MKDHASAARAHAPAPQDGSAATPRWQRFPWIPVVVAALLCAFTRLETIHSNPRLAFAFFAAAGLLGAWTILLWSGAALWGQRFGVELFPPAKSHYIQGSVQICIYLYWGWYFREVYAQLPLFIAQLVFYYGFEGLLTWSRGRKWRLGFGPLPIILSTNIFLWFRPDWYVFQFALIATAALGKEFIRWNRGGPRKVHIFNPSAFCISAFAVVLLATDTTHYTWASQIADTLNQPTYIYSLIFLLGLVVQYFFSVTLMTLCAVGTLAALGLVHTWSTGTYHFVTSNIPAPVFLGMHLLMTDPATTPRTNTGKALFGVLYGVLTFVGYGIFAYFDSYTIYDKLLPIPLLNLSVRWIDRVAASRMFDFVRRIESAFQPRRLNLAHMGVWVALFATMWSTGFVEAPHEGTTYEFWRKALDEGRPNAAKGMIDVLRFRGRFEDTAALNELGVIYAQGQIVPRDAELSMKFFGRASRLGSLSASANIAKLFLEAPSAAETASVTRAFERIESECAGSGSTPAHGALCFLLGRACETGHGRPLDPKHAREVYAHGAELANPDCRAALARLSNGAQQHTANQRPDGRTSAQPPKLPTAAPDKSDAH
ncbi:MAG: hypothetical protein EPO68_15500 [Planctomycetota bacterium]|nr:MAG: hypothetical protein EPO68_15500 [Planctomycetota bacterium]